MKRGEGAGSRFSPVFALVALSGGLMAAAFPGTGDQGWLAFVALVPLLVAIAGTTRWRAAGLGFVAGLVFWVATIPWVAQTIVHYGGLPWPLASLILLGLGGYLALYAAAFCALLCRCPMRPGALYVIVATSLWVALEFLRTYLLTGFPWNLLGGRNHYKTIACTQLTFTSWPLWRCGYNHVRYEERRCPSCEAGMHKHHATVLTGARTACVIMCPLLAPHQTMSDVRLIGSRLGKTVTRHSWQQACSPESMPRHAGNIFTNRCWCRGGVAGPPSCPIPRGLMRDDQEECSLQTTSRTSWISPRPLNEPHR